jgi:hypothetical protein
VGCIWVKWVQTGERSSVDMGRFGGLGWIGWDWKVEVGSEE